MNPTASTARSRLAEAITADRPAPGTLSGWRIGPHGVVWKSSRGIIVIDPDPPDAGPVIAGLGLILLTDGELLEQKSPRDWLDVSPEALILLPCSQIDAARASGIDHDRLFALESGDLYAQSGFLVRGIGAEQGGKTDADGRHLSLSYEIESQGLRVLHADRSFEGIAPGHSPVDALILPGSHAIGESWTIRPAPSGA